MSGCKGLEEGCRCSECTAVVRALADIDAALAECPEVEMAEETTSRILQRVAGAGPELVASNPHPQSRGPKVLRACVVQGGRVIEEMRLRRRRSVSIGWGASNDFVVPGGEGELPRHHELFVCRGGHYELVTTRSMRGRVSAEAGPMDLAQLEASGAMRRRGDVCRLRLTDRHRGKVVLGDVTVVFQFVVPPPAPQRPRLPAAARGTLWQRIDRPYTAALLGVLVLEATLVGVLEVAPKPEVLTLEDVDERWANLIVPELPRAEEPEATEPESEGSKTGPDKTTPKSVAADEAQPVARRRAIDESISGKGMLAILGTTGAGAASGAVADVLGGEGLGDDLDAAFDGITGVGLATPGGERSSRGTGSGTAAGIGGLTTGGGGRVGLGSKRETRLGSVTTAAPEVDGALDAADLARVVRSRKRMVQDCYERELKRDDSLAGKIEIEVTIGRSGRVEEAMVIRDTLATGAVGACIVNRLRRWRFPQPEGGAVTVSFPFIFTPSA